MRLNLRPVFKQLVLKPENRVNIDNDSFYSLTIKK